MPPDNQREPQVITETQHRRQDEELAAFAERRTCELDLDELDSMTTFTPSRRWIRRVKAHDRTSNE